MFLVGHSDRHASARDSNTVTFLGKLIFICLLYACNAVTGQISETKGTESRYFSSPQNAVIAATELLRKEDWMTLSSYYDLSGSRVDRRELESGRFFIRTEGPVGPGGFSRYKHPFAPGFRFDHIRPTEDPNVIAVTVFIEIDQGGGLKKRGLSEFKMRKSEKGYRILPPSGDK